MRRARDDMGPASGILVGKKDIILQSVLDSRHYESSSSSKAVRSRVSNCSSLLHGVPTPFIKSLSFWGIVQLKDSGLRRAMKTNERSSVADEPNRRQVLALSIDVDRTMTG